MELLLLIINLLLIEPKPEKYRRKDQIGDELKKIHHELKVAEHQGYDHSEKVGFIIGKTRKTTVQIGLIAQKC